ncbi:MAG: polysaccharide pyruvyl transferase CsaB [Armatimonadota bacterium]
MAVHRIVVSGYYGFGNVGDESVLAGIAATFRRLSLDVCLTVLSADPSLTVVEHQGVKAVNRYSFFDVFRVIRRSELVISGGGSLLQDVTSMLSLHYYLNILRLARLLGRKTMVYAQGVGPLIRQSSRKAVARALNRTDVISVRDPDSKTLLEEIGMTKPVYLSADPSFLVGLDAIGADRFIAEHGLLDKQLLGISLREWRGSKEWLPKVVEGIKRASAELGATCVYVSMHPSEDAKLASAFGKIVQLNSRDPRLVKGLIARCSLIVGMRLHSLMFSASVGVPFVPLVYDPKVRSFAVMSGVNDPPSVYDVTPQKLKSLILDAYSKRAELGAGLARYSSVCIDLALESGKLAWGVLKNEI